MKLIFDFDGTIHQTDIIYKHALSTTLNELSINIDSIDFKSLIGNPPAKIWKDLKIKEDLIDYYVQKTGRIMDNNLKEKGQLYDNTYKTLDYLKDKYELIICSNCRNNYMKKAREAFNLDKYFSHFITGEDYSYIDKYKILRKLNIGEYIMIGDRKNDIEAAYKNNMKSIFCSYGYGDREEGERAIFKIKDIVELNEIL